MKDDILWQRFISGDKKALGYIFKAYYTELYNYGLKLTGNKDFTMDSVQDLFLKLWKNKEHLPKVSDTKPYLFKAFRNQLIDNMKIHSKFENQSLKEEFEFNVEFSHEDIIITKQLTKEKREKIIDALNQLTPKQREAVYLRYFEDLDFETISNIMKTNIQSVRNTLHRAMSVLRKIYLPCTVFFSIS